MSWSLKLYVTMVVSWWFTQIFHLIIRYHSTDTWYIIKLHCLQYLYLFFPFFHVCLILYFLCPPDAFVAAGRRTCKMVSCVNKDSGGRDGAESSNVREGDDMLTLAICALSMVSMHHECPVAKRKERMYRATTPFVQIQSLEEVHSHCIQRAYAHTEDQLKCLLRIGGARIQAIWHNTQSTCLELNKAARHMWNTYFAQWVVFINTRHLWSIACKSIN